MLEIVKISKTYEKKPLLNDISLTVASGETICLLGPSGGGKTTLLRIIAGLEQAEMGDVRWDGASILNVAPHKRDFGLMFQDYALFPHRTVAENVAFGLKMKGLNQKEITHRVQVALEQVNMEGFGRRRVTDLSGGEQQRVALARALAPQPRLIMLDEPLGALDRSLREHLSRELRSVLKESGIPAIYVTHDQEEAFVLADRLVLILEGSVAQMDTPQGIYSHPDTENVARFMGMSNIISGRLEPDRRRVQTEWGVFEVIPDQVKSYSADTNLRLLIRPGGAKIFWGESQTNFLDGIVLDCVFKGECYLCEIDFGKGLQMSFNFQQGFQIGKSLRVIIDPDQIILFKGDCR